MARLLAWLLEAVIIIMIVRAVMRLFSGRSRGPSGPRAGGSPFPPKTTERIGGALVRDPQCGTHIPMSSAIRVTDGGETRYFCSAECRDAFRARA
jgi:YHS domain-containing protein